MGFYVKTIERHRRPAHGQMAQLGISVPSEPHGVARRRARLHGYNSFIRWMDEESTSMKRNLFQKNKPLPVLLQKAQCQDYLFSPFNRHTNETTAL